MLAKDNVSLSIEALIRLNAKFKPQTSTQIKSCVVSLFLAESDGVMKYTNIIGLLQLDVQRKIQAKFLRLYNMDTMKLAFEVQLYYDFANHYMRLDDKFYYFGYPVGTIGLLFRNKQDADSMLRSIKEHAPTMKQYEEIMTEFKLKEKKQQQSKGIFGKLKIMIFQKEQEVQESSEVLGFQKVYVTRIDAGGNLMQEGKSPLEVDLIERLGLSEKDKSNKDLMNMIATDLVIHQLKKQAIQNPQPQIMELIKEHQKQQNEYLQQCQQKAMLQLPPPPPPPPILSPNNRISFNRNTRANLLDQIRNNNIKLKHVETNQKGGVNIDLSSMDTVERDDFATALRKKIAMRQKALNKYRDDSDEDR